MILFENVQIKFGDFVAVDNVNIDIKRKEFFTLLGSSGSGKSTTLKALSGFNKVSKGQIYLDGENITKKPIEKRNIGMVFQSYALFPSMNVYENIAFGLKIDKWSKDKIEERVKELAKMVELTEEQLKKMFLIYLVVNNNVLPLQED
ncbi:ABC transporter ATP-binding protein [Staphylococcus haemolyticus]|uniref:ABC transporter ATP-binding protein n=1 Tax=Staphylococcus haemolyticus TaxID=1283 RepID=UPI0034D4BB5D